MREIDYRGGKHLIVRSPEGVDVLVGMDGAWEDGLVWKIPAVHNSVHVSVLMREHGYTITDSAAEVVNNYRGEPEPSIEPSPEPPQNRPTEPKADRVREEAAKVNDRQVTLHSAGIVSIRFNFDPSLVSIVKQVPGARFDRSVPEWRAPINRNTGDHIRQLASLGFVVADDVDAEIIALTGKADFLTELSRATGDTGFVLPPKVVGSFERRPFQGAVPQYVAEVERALIGDKMGLGKTVEALVTLENEEAYPAVLIVPAIAKYVWLAHVESWLPHRTVMVCDGMKRAPNYDFDLVIINYDILGVDAEKNKKTNRTVYTPTPGGHLDALVQIRWEGLVSDESHMLKNWKALRTQGVNMLANGLKGAAAKMYHAVKSLGKGVRIRMLLSGTLEEKGPAELISQLRIIDRLGDFGGWKHFTNRYCAARHDGYGWDISGASNLLELHDRLRATCMVRRRTEDVQEDLPALQRTNVPVDITNRREYQKALDRVLQYVRDFALEMGCTMQEALGKMSKAQRAKHLVQIGHLRRVCAEGKMEAARAWVENFLENTDEKLLIFGWHRKIVETLGAEFADGMCITGDTSSKKRTEMAQQFQRDDGPRVLALNLLAGGVSLTLTKATHVMFMQLGWTFAQHEQAEGRTQGRQDDIALARAEEGVHVQATYLLGRDTYDADMLDLIMHRKAVGDAVLDGIVPDDPDAPDINVAEGLLKILAGEAA